eukprot:jgi/Mesvir1/28/Mv25838-RA.1
MEAPGPPITAKMIKLARRIKSKNWNDNALELSANEALRLIRAGGHWCEVLKEDDVVKPYLDYDLKFDHEEGEPGVTVDDIINDVFENCNINHENVKVLTRRPRWVETKGKRTFKYSFRVYVKGWKVTVKDMGRLMKAKLLQLPGWDDSIYNDGRLLNCVYNTKDVEPGCPILSPVDDNEPIETFVAQLVDDDAKWLPVDDLIDGLEPPAKKGKKSSGGKRDVGRPSTRVFATSSDEITHLDSDDIANVTSRIVARWTERYPNFEDHALDAASLHYSKDRDNYVLRTFSHLCLGAGREHGSNHTYLVVSRDGIVQKCHDSDCRDFSSEVVALGDELKSLLFPSEDATTSYILAHFENSHRGVAEACVVGFAGTWRYSGGSLWNFRDHRWRQLMTDEPLRNAIGDADKLKLKYEEVARYFSERRDKAEHLGDDKKAAYFDALADSAAKISRNLRDGPYINYIRNEVRAIIYAEPTDFVERLDRNPYLLCFTNGVLELTTMTLRPGRPDDMLSKQMRIPYTPDADTCAMEVKLEEIFPDEVTRAHFKRFLGSLMVGDNRDEQGYFWKGSGRNGKGFLMKVIREAYGDNADTVRTAFYTSQERDSDVATPEVLRMRGMRIGLTNELQRNVPIVASKFKNITGNGVLKARALHSNEYVQFPTSFKLILDTNNDVKFDEHCEGLWDRAVMYPFVSKFCTRKEMADEPDRPHMHLVDTTLNERAKEFALGLMAISIRECVVYLAATSKDERWPPRSEEMRVLKTDSKVSSDGVGAFIEELKKSGELVKCSGEAVPVKVLLDEYIASTGMDSYKAKLFGDEAKAVLGCRLTQYKLSDGSRPNCFIGWRYCPS